MAGISLRELLVALGTAAAAVVLPGTAVAAPATEFSLGGVVVRRPYLSRPGLGR